MWMRGIAPLGTPYLGMAVCGHPCALPLRRLRSPFLHISLGRCASCRIEAEPVSASTPDVPPARTRVPFTVIKAVRKPAQRRRGLRRKEDLRVIRLQVRPGDPNWLTGDLLDTSQSGIGISVPTPLSVGSTIAVRSRLLESRRSLGCRGCSQWCPTMHGNYQAGLEYAESWSSLGSDSPSINAQAHEEPDFYEILQLSPKAQADTIDRVYRILAQRYHPNTPQTADLEMFLSLYEAHRLLSDPELRAQYDLRRHESKRLQPPVSERTWAENEPSEHSSFRNV